MAYGPKVWHTNPPLLCHMNLFYWEWGWSSICRVFALEEPSWEPEKAGGGCKGGGGCDTVPVPRVFSLSKATFRAAMNKKSKIIPFLFLIALKMAFDTGKRARCRKPPLRYPPF